MERAEGARTPYEVYCFHCRVTFPAEARRCLHCGGQLYGPSERPGAAAQLASSTGPAIPAGNEDDEGPVQMARRFGGIAVWALVALAAVLQNLCHRG
jgi:hypothetical protein